MSYPKTNRQLLLYEIIFTSREIKLSDLTRRFEVDKRTIQRDIADLTDAGLVKLTYNKKDDVYEKKPASEKIAIKEGSFRYTHLVKLKRLTDFMKELSEAADYSYEDSYNCKNRYFEMFPDTSERTRMRDYQILAQIGYTIRWDEYEKRHIVNGYLYQSREEW